MPMPVTEAQVTCTRLICGAWVTAATSHNNTAAAPSRIVRNVSGPASSVP